MFFNNKAEARAKEIETRGKLWKLECDLHSAKYSLSQRDEEIEKLENKITVLTDQLADKNADAFQAFNFNNNNIIPLLIERFEGEKGWGTLIGYLINGTTVVNECELYTSLDEHNELVAQFLKLKGE